MNFIVNQAKLGILIVSHVKQSSSIIDLNTNCILKIIQLLNFIGLEKTLVFLPESLYKMIVH